MKKVCIISVSLGKGGLERSCANLSQLLYDNGYDVHLVVLNDDVDYEYKGQLFNLGKYKTEDDSLLKRLQRFRKLRTYFRKHKFDYVIDNRIGNQPWRELYYMFYIYGLRQKVVYVQHNSKLELHFPKKSIVSWLLEQYAIVFVGVSKYITATFNYKYNSAKAITIYNYAKEIEPTSLKNTTSDYILYLGRIDDNHKNIRLLLQAYSVMASKSSVELLIVGAGPDEKLIMKTIKELSLDRYVKVLSFQSDVYSLLKQAKFLALSSRFEGFPMVIVEALSVGTPVVSVDCISGPSEVIKNECNGLLVPNFNVEALSLAMDRMVSDEELYLTCSNNANESIKHLSASEIVKLWNKILV